MQYHRQAIMLVVIAHLITDINSSSVMIEGNH